VFSWKDIVNLAVDKTDDSFFRQINFEAIGRIAPKHPLLKSFDLSLIKNHNSYSRFCIFLKQPLFNYDIKLWSSITLFSAQSKLLNKCLAIDQVDAFLESGLEAYFDFEQFKPDQFALCDNLKFADELKIICLGHPVTLAIKSGIFHQQPDADYKKDNWELFWQMYNLLQFHDFNGVEKELKVEDPIKSIEQVLEFFSVELHEIVRALIEKHIVINFDYDFELIEDEIIVAQAALGSEAPKFFMLPFDEESRKRFIKSGFAEYTFENFNINNL